MWLATCLVTAGSELTSIFYSPTAENTIQYDEIEKGYDKAKTLKKQK